MIGQTHSEAADPRADLSDADLKFATERAAPMVARKGGRSDLAGLGACALGACVLGAITFISLNGSRAEPAEPASPAPAAISTMPPISVESAPEPTTVAARADFGGVAAAPRIDPATVLDPNQSRASALIIDNSGPTGSPSTGAAAASANAAPTNLNADEAFAFRVTAGAGDTAQATRLANPGAVVIQGSVIPAVLETALNSDTPGYTRAVVSRDVKSFDGKRVLIPRGSRLIGQYKSGLSSGQSRAFVIWNRLVRPDGVSIELASPAMDGEGSGLGGRVDRHYVQRYGAATLLSLISGLASGLGGSSSNTVVVSSGGMQSAAAQALSADASIPPTIRVPQGTPIQVFVARDLDFSAS